MSKLLLALLPALVSFGPIFMTGMGGTILSDDDRTLRAPVLYAGAFMTSSALLALWRALVKQEARIDRLTKELERLARAGKTET